jgi:hypothetical protein
MVLQAALIPVAEGVVEQLPQNNVQQQAAQA